MKINFARCCNVSATHYTVMYISKIEMDRQMDKLSVYVLKNIIRFMLWSTPVPFKCAHYDIIQSNGNQRPC